jgi:hypothetical protein
MKEQNKDYILSKFADQGKLYTERYPEQMELLESSTLSKVKNGIDSYDRIALGKQLEQFETYMAMPFVEANVNQLGEIPKIAFNVITAVMGQSVLPVIASVQPIEEEKGLVYFENIKSSDTRGSQTAGDVLVDPRSGVVTPTGYANSKVTGEVAVASTTAATLTYTPTLLIQPVKSESLRVELGSNSAIFCKDIGPTGADKNIGTLIGNELSGTVNYTTGALSLRFAQDPGNGDTLVASYAQNFELSTDIPTIELFMDSKLVTAQVYALKGTIGMIQQFVMQKRFGGTEGLAKRLVQEINREIAGDAIRKIAAAAVGTTTFARTLPGSGSVSAFAHKQQYLDKLYESENVMLGNAGRGEISVMIVGRKHAATVKSLPGFKKLSDGNQMGPHVFGQLDGITYVRVPESAMLGIDRGIGLHKGATPWEAACVYAPFMPMAVTSLLPEGINPLSSQVAAAQMAATDTLLPNFSTNYDLSGDFA